MRAVKPFLLLFVIIYWTVVPAIHADPERQKLILTKEIVDNGNKLMARQKFPQALQEYEKCLAIDPENAVAKANIVLLHNNWGIYYFQHNQYQDAQNEWQTALKLDPNNAKAKNNLLILKRALAKLGLPLEQEKEQTKEDNFKEGDNNSSIVILHTNKSEEKKSEDKPVSMSPVESELSNLELRVYGRTIDNLPIIRRIEKLEIDSFGQISDLPIMERINRLNNFLKKE